MIVGITGTLGAGKGTIVEILKKHDFIHFSVRALIIEHIKKRNLPVNRDSMQAVANSLRQEHGPSYLVDELFTRAKKAKKSAVIESIRCPGEVESLREKGEFLLLAVDADPKKRYERVIKRGSTTDMVSFEEFVEQEEQEMQSTDPFRQNISWCMKHADIALTNNSSIDELEANVEKLIKEHL